MRYGNSNPDYTPSDIGPPQTSAHPNWKVGEWELMTKEEQSTWVDEHPEELASMKVVYKSNEDDRLKEADIANDSLK